MQGNPYYVDLAGNYMQGYKAATMPQQMREEQQMAQLKNAYLQQQMQSEEQMNPYKLKQIQLQNQGLVTTNDIEKQKLQQAQIDMQRRAAFMKMLQGGNSGSNNSQSTQTNPYATMPGMAPPPAQTSTSAPTSNPQGMGGGQAPGALPVNYNAKYGQTTPNPRLMNAGPSPQAVPAVNDPGAMPMGSPQQGGMQQPRPMGQPQQPSGMDQLDALWANPQTRAMYGDYLKEMGISGKEQIINDPQTGQAFIATTLPSGRVTFQAQQIGPTAEETAFAKEKGKGKAALYNNAVAQNMQLSQSSIAIQDLVKRMENPELKNVIGPWMQSKATTLFGTPEQQELLGGVRTDSGKVFTDLMKSMQGTGAISDREGNEFRKMKPNENDTWATMFGKIKASELSSQIISQRNNAYIRNMDNGMSSNEALQAAQKEVPFDKVHAQIERTINPPVTLYKDGVPHEVPKNKVNSEMMKKWGYSYER